MTDARSETTSIADRIRPLSVGAPWSRCIFSATMPVFVLGEEALVFWRDTARAARGGPWRRHPRMRRATASASSPAATTATWWRPTPTRAAKPWRPTPSGAGSIMLRSDPTAWRGRPASRPIVRAAKGETRARPAVERRAGSHSRRKVSASRSRTTTARRCGFPTRPTRRPKSSNGRVRISTSPSARTADSWSPRCRSRRCTAGGSSTASTCACRATPPRCAR